MSALELLLRGVACGVIIAAPVGPVNVLCIQRTIFKGWRSGLLSGFGSALADTIYGSFAAFSISFVIAFLVREEFRIRFYGGLLLIAIGAWSLLRRPRALGAQVARPMGHSEYVTTFLLTLTNPTTVLSFLAVLAALRLGEQRSVLLTLVVVLGIFCGAMLWWCILTGVVYRFRDKFSDRALKWVDRAGGIAIGLFGVITLALSRRSG